MHDFKVDRPVYVDTSSNILPKKKQMPSTVTRKKKGVELVAGTNRSFRIGRMYVGKNFSSSGKYNTINPTLPQLGLNPRTNAV